MATESLTEQWVDAYAARLYRAAALLSSEAEAADLCQEVFLVAARKHAAFDGRSAPYTWLYGILRNLIRDRRKRYARRGLRLVPAPETAPPSDPEVELSASQQRERVRRAVSTLPERHREVITLYYLEELAIAEVAQRLGAPIGTVKSRLFQARAALKRTLKGVRS